MVPEGPYWAHFFFRAARALLFALASLRAVALANGLGEQPWPVPLASSPGQFPWPAPLATSPQPRYKENPYVNASPST